MKISKNKRLLSIVQEGQPRQNFRYTHVPSIHLSGKWLEEAGFTTGGIAEVEVNHKGNISIRMTGKKRVTQAIYKDWILNEDGSLMPVR